MAGRFLTPEEAARQLGVSVDELNRLVDRKKLFPMRDGASLKFKADEIERLVQQGGDEGSLSGDLSLDLETPAAASPAAGGQPAASGIDVDDLVLGDAIDAGESIFSGEPSDARSASQTLVRGDAAVAGVSGAGGSGLSMPSLEGGAGASAADIIFGGSGIGDAIGGDDLALESIVSASSPSLPPPAKTQKPAAEGTVSVDLSDIGLGDDGGKPGRGSTAGASAISNAAGSALSGVLDSGLSLEGADLQVSGIDLGGLSEQAAPADGGTVLATGDEFELGGLDVDDESASVVIATDSESGDSSFFGQTMAGDGSSISDESASLGSSSVATESLDYPLEYAVDMKFSIWQILGLVCCSLLMLFGGFVAYDLVRTIGSAEGTSLSNPLLDAMADTFGWR